VEALKLLRATQFDCMTASPLTLHLARASAMENAGVCLHPLYGFLILPGSGLKGMARAWAETIWLPTGKDKAAGEATIQAVFGNHPGASEAQHAGDVVFHDAWPTTWPPLSVDICNNHHPGYYQGSEEPGDWENPIPVYFLVSPPGVIFSFALSRRRADVPDERLELARSWLLGALCHLGAGAKTAAGYGLFKPVPDATPPLPADARAVAEYTLELVTPAFLAGASQNADDCDLRPATLRGVLRWWWRQIFWGYLDNKKDLLPIESALWGNTTQQGAIQIRIITQKMPVKKRIFNKYEYKRDSEYLESEHGIKTLPNGQDNTNLDTTTQGVWYISYGIADKTKNRSFINPGQKYRIQIVTKSVFLHGQEISAEEVMTQAKAALHYLCRLGGVGAKARKGFGSLQLHGSIGRDTVDAARNILSKLMNIYPNIQFNSQKTSHITSNGIQFPFDRWPDPWMILEQIGFAVQAFAKQFAHDGQKRALGLPRICDEKKGKFEPQGTFGIIYNDPKNRNKLRYASPAHIHIERDDSNKCYIVRIATITQECLPDRATSRDFLKRFREEVRQILLKKAELKGQPFPRPRHP